MLSHERKAGFISFFSCREEIKNIYMLGQLLNKRMYDAMVGWFLTRARLQSL